MSYLLSAKEARDQILAGTLTSEALVRSCLDRIDETDNTLHAWAYVDAEGAIEQARELDQIRRQGKPTGLLHGVPVGIKDIIDTKDMPTERGSPIFQDRRPKDDAELINCLKEAGAIILGKTVTTELAFLHPSETRNPHNIAYSPGGSSSGSAAAVAAYQVPLAIGTQTNGSVIRPASFCGVFATKPTSGVISRTGVLRTSVTLDQVGGFGRSLEDLAILNDALATYDPRDINSYPYPKPHFHEGYAADPPVTPNLAWLDLPFSDRLSEEATAAFKELKSVLSPIMETIPCPPAFAGLPDTLMTIHLYEFCQHQAETIETRWYDLSETIKPYIEKGRAISHSQYEEAIGTKTAASDFFDAFFKDFDAILCPSSTGAAPTFEKGTGDPCFSTIWTLSGLPCLNLPLLSSLEDMPMGVQLIGGREEDDRLMRTARWLLNELTE
ncbi:amidase [Rhodobacteraceae bacterium RKSG542]|uniref:amidase n=1 Tax=Pseudovibrio flavus TaxID=2529854 RepID=UPI0012BD5910|nr:amidase [Pseudovibrio flavus]MTI16279.1 amidase [Pseudovibrio flavus]